MSLKYDRCLEPCLSTVETREVLLLSPPVIVIIITKVQL